MGEQTTPRRFRKKPVEIEAMLYTGDNGAEVARWAGWMIVFVPDDAGKLGDRGLVIRTAEGEMRALPGDWITKGVAGEFYPCKPSIFEATYESVEGMDLSGVLEGSRLGQPGGGT